MRRLRASEFRALESGMLLTASGLGFGPEVFMYKDKVYDIQSGDAYHVLSRLNIYTQLYVPIVYISDNRLDRNIQGYRFKLMGDDMLYYHWQIFELIRDDDGVFERILRDEGFFETKNSVTAKRLATQRARENDNRKYKFYTDWTPFGAWKEHPLEQNIRCWAKTDHHLPKTNPERYEQLMLTERALIFNTTSLAKLAEALTAGEIDAASDPRFNS